MSVCFVIKGSVLPILFYKNDFLAESLNFLYNSTSYYENLPMHIHEKKLRVIYLIRIPQGRNNFLRTL